MTLHDVTAQLTAIMHGWPPVAAGILAVMVSKTLYDEWSSDEKPERGAVVFVLALLVALSWYVGR